MRTRVRQLESLTGMRFAAAFVVYLHHAGFFLWANRPPSLLRILTVPGTAGVTFFFILSGFVLAWSWRDGDAARSFFRRRAARIIPAYLLTAFFGVAVSAHGRGIAIWLVQAIFTFTLLQSWIPSWLWYMAGNGVSWSLSDEVFFYSVFPMLFQRLRGLATRTAVRWLGGIAALAMVLPILVHPQSDDSGLRFWFTYVFPVTRLLEFIAGVLLAVLVSRGFELKANRWLIYALCVASYVAIAEVPIFLRFATLTMIPFLLLIWRGASADLRGEASVWRRAALVKLGQWSFAFYLLHQIVLRVVAILLGSQHHSVLFGTCLTAGCFALCIVLAGLMYELFERPLERRLRPSADRSRVALEVAE